MSDTFEPNDKSKPRIRITSICALATALVNTITGFYRATHGSILLNGQEISQMPMHAISSLGISRSFQNIRLFKRMSVLENVLVAFKAYSQSPMRSLFHVGTKKAYIEEAMSWLEQLQLSDRANTLASSLSYGDARRLEIARALASGPQLLLLDEPAAGMNQVETHRLTEDIQKIRSKVLAILLIEHDMSLMRTAADRIVAMDYGKKIVEGPADMVLSHPTVLKAYLGEEAEESSL
ncbi:ABC transporter ATP-binding protein [Eoetvoesiella caeni]